MTGAGAQRFVLMALAALLAACNSPSDDCRGPGRYQAGKEGSYRPCCAGLTEVLYQLPSMSNGARVCGSPPLRVYACVRGTCGDGICEAGEAPACGCVADCPDAAWGAGDAGAADGP
jgi:hypothetical protein